MARRNNNSGNRSNLKNQVSQKLEKNFDIDTSGNFMDKVKELASNPTVRYVATGVGIAVLNRLATNMSGKYPEISKFIRENIGTFEEQMVGDHPGSSDEASMQ